MKSHSRLLPDWACRKVCVPECGVKDAAARRVLALRPKVARAYIFRLMMRITDACFLPSASW